MGGSRRGGAVGGSSSRRMAQAPRARQQEQQTNFRSVEFDETSLTDPYQKYAEDPADGWITGVMKSGQKGYDLPREVTLATALNSPFRYYGGY